MEKNKNFTTDWSSPKTNFIAGINSLRKALNNGMNVKLIKMRNEDCDHSIKIKNDILKNDFRKYKFSNGFLRTKDDIRNDNNLNEFSKHLTLNYFTAYGKENAVKNYYDNNILSDDNFIGYGVSHLVLVKDPIKHFKSIGNHKHAELLYNQYVSNDNKRHFFDNYVFKKTGKAVIKKFKRKLWVVATFEKDVKINQSKFILFMNWLLYPVKYILKKTVLEMPKYTKYGFRIGSVNSGYEVEFQIPKNFSFN